LKGINLQELGIPSHQRLIEMYCERMGIPLLENFDFYMAFSFFRVAAILQGVYKRSTQGERVRGCERSDVRDVVAYVAFIR